MYEFLLAAVCRLLIVLTLLGSLCVQKTSKEKKTEKNERKRERKGERSEKERAG